MKESSEVTGEKQDEQTQPGREFLVMAAKQKAHSSVNPSLLRFGDLACWSSVCICAPVQTSSTTAAGYEGGTMGRVCLLTMEAGEQIEVETRRGEERQVVRESRWCGANWLVPSGHGGPGWHDAAADEITQICCALSTGETKASHVNRRFTLCKRWIQPPAIGCSPMDVSQKRM